MTCDHEAELAGLPGDAARIDHLCEVNVRAQVQNVAYSPVIRRAWARGQDVTLHGWIYGLDRGLLHDLDCGMAGLQNARHFAG